MAYNPKIHFIGIGGIGISALARMMLLEGKKVSGSDASASDITKELKKLGVKIYLGHKADNLKAADLVVYTLAIASENPELLKAKKLQAKKLTQVLSYPELLGRISRDKYTIAVAGTHGKTTTTAMIGKVLMDAKLNPTIVVGSLLKDIKSNFVSGKGRYFVCEACEYKKSFLNLTPKIIVVTNIDNDHLDYYRDLKDIQKAFSQLVSKLGSKDILVCNPNDSAVKPIVQKAKCKVVDYLKYKTDFSLKIPGNHNVLNAQAALAIAGVLGIKKDVAVNSLNNFSGTWRRFEYKGKSQNGALVYDDYAHHPTEIKAALQGAREMFGKQQIFTVFQPHLFSRTKVLLKDFSESFNDTDVVVVTDIYAAREKNDKTIHSRNLVARIQKHHPAAFYIKNFDDIADFLKKNSQKDDVIITMGAGDIFKVADLLNR